MAVNLTPKEAEAMYAAREAQVKVLSQQPSISADDVKKLHRHGRFQVACELWSKCDSTAKTSLLNDEHHHVRSAAILN